MALPTSLVSRLRRFRRCRRILSRKTLRILVGSPPGGGYDIYARLVAPALAAKLGPTVLVEGWQTCQTGRDITPQLRRIFVAIAH